MNSERVVIVGAGMVGHRLADELVRRDREGRLDIHLVGDEPYAPYNRILLSEVVAGRMDLAALALPDVDERVTFHRGTTAMHVERSTRRVFLDDVRTLDYDRLAIATGADAFVPPVPGLIAPDGSMPRHAHVLRTLDDCREVAARAVNARRGVVLGGGVLGLEAACGLALRGVEVTLVHAAGHLAQTNLDAFPAATLAALLGDLGIDVRTDSSLGEVRAVGEELSEVVLPDGSVVPADLLLVSCGIRPRTALAVGAGLTCAAGIVVGADLTSPDDDRIAALGDCAQPPEGSTGLVAPGWEQARRLAASWTGGDLPASAPPPAAVRLKAAGVDLVTTGLRSSEAHPDLDRVVTLADHGGRRHVEMVVRGDRLAGMTCLGAPDLAAALSVAFDRATPMPSDPLTLLVPDRSAGDGSPALMPSATTVCRCNGVTKREIVSAWEDGARDVPEVASCTRATTGCGSCRSVVCGLLDWLESSDPAPDPEPGRPARRTSQPVGVLGETSVSGVQHEGTSDETWAS